MNRAPVTQLKMPEARRPQASEIHEQKNRPAIAEMLIQITSFEASGALILRTITRSVTSPSASATPPVWVRPVRQPAMMLRGYLKISTHRVFSTGGGKVGIGIVAGSTCN